MSRNPKGPTANAATQSREADTAWTPEQVSGTNANASYQELEQTVAGLRQQLVQAQKLASLGQMVAGIVHDLNNPTTAILAYTEYLRRGVETKRPNDASAADDLERLARITESAERIHELTKSLAIYARPAKGATTLDLVRLLETALRFCEHEFAEANVVVQRNLGEVSRVRGISSNLVQAFVNLFTNASHAMADTGGKLVLELQHSETGDSVLLDIRDGGVGIAPADLERIFDPFFTTKPEGRGTGLGLAIVKEIIDAHGGSVSVESAPGKGSTFRIELPAEPVMSGRIRRH